MQHNSESHSLKLTPSISKIHHNLQNTLNTLFWLVIYFHSPKQFSGAETPTSKRTSLGPEMWSMRPSSHGERRTEAGLRLWLQGSAHFDYIILSLTGYHEGGGLLLMGLQDCLSEALGKSYSLRKTPTPWLQEKTSAQGCCQPCRCSFWPPLVPPAENSISIQTVV